MDRDPRECLAGREVRSMYGRPEPDDIEAKFLHPEFGDPCPRRATELVCLSLEGNAGISFLPICELHSGLLNDIGVLDRPGQPMD